MESPGDKHKADLIEGYREKCHSRFLRIVILRKYCRDIQCELIYYCIYPMKEDVQ